MKPAELLLLSSGSSPPSPGREIARLEAVGEDAVCALAAVAAIGGEDEVVRLLGAGSRHGRCRSATA
jgi:hypothetical protein